MGFLIDSSVFIGMERRGHGIDYLVNTFPDEDLALAAITASELLVGAYRAESPERRSLREDYIQGIIEHMPVEPFDLRVARAHGRLWAQLAGAGQLIGSHDLLIAATALVVEYSVLTLNLRDFRRVPGLDVIQPEW